MKYKISISKKDIKSFSLIIILCVQMLIPAYFSEMLDKMPVLALLLSYVSIVIMLMIVAGSPVKISFPLIWLIVEYVILLVSTILNGGNLLDTVVYSATIILLCLSVYVILQDERKTKVFLYTVTGFVFVLFFINIIIGLIYPSGIPGYTTDINIPKFLCGNINATIRYIFPGIICSTIIDVKYKHRISIPTIIFYLGMIYFIFGVYFMATAFIGLLYILLWKILKPILQKRKRIVFALTMVLVASVEIFMVVGLGSSLLFELVSAIFGKSLTFSGRALLWANALMRISEKPIWGYGFKDNDFFRYFIGNSAGSHNYYLDILIQRGIMGLAWFMAMLIYILYKLKDETTEIVYLLLGFLGGYLIMFLAEPYVSTERFHMTLIYILALYLNRAKKPAYRKI